MLLNLRTKLSASSSHQVSRGSAGYSLEGAAPSQAWSVSEDEDAPYTLSGTAQDPAAPAGSKADWTSHDFCQTGCIPRGIQVEVSSQAG
mmetsp:Transcript_52785/g.114067  ORF Transcript_52785/g.114067 Transcript_52785/m.114067 type:complete len:89 (-) Transcript_52785:258-524(-)